MHAVDNPTVSNITNKPELNNNPPLITESSSVIKTESIISPLNNKNISSELTSSSDISGRGN